MSAAVLMVMNQDTGEWAQLALAPGDGVDSKGGQLWRLSNDEFAVRVAQNGGDGYAADEYRGEGFQSVDGGETWAQFDDPIDPAFLSAVPVFHSADKGAAEKMAANWSDDFSGLTPGDSNFVFRKAVADTTWEVLLGAGFGAIPSNVRYDETAAFALHTSYASWLDDPIDATAPAAAIFSRFEADPSSFVRTQEVPGPYVRKEDYPLLGEFGDGDRLVFAMHEAVTEDGETIDGLRSVIVTADRGELADILAPEFGYRWNVFGQPYSADDRGRPIGITRAPDTTVIFCGWEDGTMLRSSDNGDTWEEMTRWTEFETADCMTYDWGSDYLWVVGRIAGEIAAQVWTLASTTAAASIDATRNLPVVGTLSNPRTAGHLGLVLRSPGTGGTVASSREPAYTPRPIQQPFRTRRTRL